jgi:hypothetical protein
MRRGTVVALVLAVTLVMISDASADPPPDQVKTLAGVPSFSVFVDELSKDLIQAGLSTDTLKTDVELRLRTVGIRVATEEERSLLPGSPCLVVHVDGFRSTAGKVVLGYCAAVSFAFFQDVHLDRQPSIGVSAATVSAMTITCGPTADAIRETLRDIVDKFANAYLAANPKR